MSFQPFRTIALSLSGGGYRATAFHMGVLSFLEFFKFQFSDERDLPPAEQISLADRVVALSTISGGTISGMIFAQHRAEGKPFQSGFQKLYRLLEKDALLSTALAKLNNQLDWHDPARTRNLINAFADCYNEAFFEDQSFGIFFKDQMSDSFQVMFNATEFSTGLAFRFQNDGYFGNNNFRIPKELASTIPLGNIVAASSCFPGGFEPLVFPQDFSAPGDTQLHDFWRNRYPNPVAIMDGGIIDNQGIDGIDLAEDRLCKKGLEVGTYIVSSVEGKNIDPFVPAVDQGKAWWLRAFSLKRVRQIAFGKFLASLLIFALLFVFKGSLGTVLFAVGLVFASIMFLLTGGFLLLYSRARKWIGRSIDELVQQEGSGLLQNLEAIEKAPLSVVFDLVGVRALSFLSMVNGIFLRRIRRVQFKEVFRGDKWKKRAKGNFIYDLMEKPPAGLSDAWKDIIQTANTMGTTLWFSEENKKNGMLPKLIQCGQLTICHQLLDYLETVKEMEDYPSLPNSYQQDLDRLYLRMIETQQKLLKNPNLILNHYLKNYNS